MTSGRVHDLKCWPEPFAALLDGSKTFECRRDDRGYMVGDVLVVGHWDPALLGGQGYWRSSDGREALGHDDRHALRFLVTYVLHGSRFGVQENFVVMGIKKEADIDDSVRSKPDGSTKDANPA